MKFSAYAESEIKFVSQKRILLKDGTCIASAVFLAEKEGLEPSRRCLDGLRP